jgi:hypothetical protein
LNSIDAKKIGIKNSIFKRIEGGHKRSLGIFGGKMALIHKDKKIYCCGDLTVKERKKKK